MSDLIRFGVSIDKKLLKKFDQHIADSYNTRSEAIRDLIRDKLVEKTLETNGVALGTITLVYDHHQRGLTDKLLELQHNYHDLISSNLHQHISHNYCLEVIVVKGDIKSMHNIAEKIIGLKGVKHGKLVVTAPEENIE